MEVRKNYFCIAGDIKKSSDFNSAALLNEMVNFLNTNYKTALITPFDIRLGDEIIGTVDSFSVGYRIVFDLHRIMREHHKGMYLGIGFGKIDNPEIKSIHRVNGSAIRSAIKARDDYLKKRHPDSELFQRIENPISSYAAVEDITFPCKALNHLLNEILDKLDNQTEKQMEVVKYYEQSASITYKEIAQQMGDSTENEANISKILKRANYSLIKDAKEGLFQLADYLQASMIL
jgi:hypothetical protein